MRSIKISRLYNLGGIKLRNKSYFKKIFRDFLVTLIAPIISIVFLYFQTESVVKEQIMLTNSNTLSQFFRLIDSTMKEMSNTSIALANNDLCRSYVGYAMNGNMEERAAYYAFNIVNMLNDYDNEKYYDVFVYYPSINHVISGRSSLSADYYFKSQYGIKERNSWKGLAEMLECESKRPTLYVVNRDDEQPLLCVAMHCSNSGKHDMSYVAVQILKPEYLAQIMTNDNLKLGGTILIFDKNKELLLSGDGSTGYHLNEYMNFEIPYEAEFESGKFMLQVQEAQGIDAYYVFATPFEYFWEKLSGMQLSCILGGIICACISIIVAYRGTKSAYSPLESMVRILEERGILHYDSKVKTEVEFMETILEKENDEKNNLKTNVRKSEAIRLERFVMTLLEGEASGEFSSKDEFIKNGITLYSGEFYVAIISVTNNDDIKSEMQAFIIKNVFEELCNREHQGYIVRISTNQYAALVNLRESIITAEEIDVWKEGQTFLYTNFKMVVTIAFGRIHDGMFEIQQSYKEAQKALKYKYLWGEGKCIDYTQIEGRQFNYITSVESKLSKMIIGYMKDEKSTMSAEQFVLDILDMYEVNEEAAIESVECFKYEMISVINKAIVSNSGVIDDGRELIEELILQPTLEGFREKFIYILDILRKVEQESVQREDICKRVQDYIIEHYRESDLSVAILGEKMNMSPSYLSRQFKTKYKISIPDYISQTRVKSSKKDLKDTSKSVKQIAEENGFLSSTVFINAFKRWEGITPGIYRNFE